MHSVNSPDCSFNSKSRELGVATLVYATVLVVLWSVTGRTPVHGGYGHDGRFYAAMVSDADAAGPWGAVSPYCFRVLTPLMVSALPGPVVTRFAFFNLLVWTAAISAWHLLARRTGLSAVQSLFGGLVLATSAWGPMNAFYNPCYVDPMMHLFMIAGLLLMVDRSRWLAILLPISLLQREQTFVFILVCAIVMEVQEGGWSWSRLNRYGGILAACVGVYVGLHGFIRPVVSAASTPWETAFAVAFNLYDNPAYLAGSCLAVFYALGVPLVGAVLLPGARRFLNERRWPLYFLFMSFLCLFGGSDKGRLAFVAMPVVLLMLLHGVRDAVGRRMPAILFAGLLAVHLFVQFPPGLMIADGRLIAPLVDDPDRGTHLASSVIPAVWPTALSSIALHLAVALGLAAAMLGAIRLSSWAGQQSLGQLNLATRRRP